MSRTRWLLLGAVIVLVVSVGFASRCRVPRPQAAPPSPPTSSVSPERVKEPNVAGAFYPADPAELRALVDAQLAQAKPERIANLRGLVCPHAGYVFSGPVAAFCYQELAGRSTRTVALLGPSHHAYFEGVSILAADAYRTPLGLVLLSELAARLSASPPFNTNPEAHAREHSVEVQLPFLQRVLPEANIIPMVFGVVDEVAVGQRLARELPADVLVVASSDLSHYHPYEVAEQLDHSTIEAILSLDVDRLRHEELCGKGPVLALLALARQRGWQARLLDYRNSGDTAGDKSKVVGYSAIAFFDGGGHGG